MSSIPSPGTIHIIVHTEPAEWWEILAVLGPLAVLFAVTIVACIGLNNARLKEVGRLRAFDQNANAASQN